MFISYLNFSLATDDHLEIWHLCMEQYLLKILKRLDDPSVISDKIVVSALYNLLRLATDSFTFLSVH
jgi:hypothetical protein